MALATGGALGSTAVDAGARPRIALGYGLGVAELLAVVGAALAAAIGLSREIATGRAGTILVRPLGREAYALGRFAGAAAVGLAVAVAGVGTALLVIAVGVGVLGSGGDASGAGGPGAGGAASVPAGFTALEALAPRAEFQARLRGRFGLATGEEEALPFEPPEALRDRTVTLRLKPRYQFLRSSAMPTPVVVRLRVGVEVDGQTLTAVEVEVPTLRAGEVELPAGAMAGRLTRLVLEPLTADAVLGFGPGTIALRGPRESLVVGALAAAGGIALEAAFIAALATLGATFLSDWVAIAFALGLGLAARAPDVLKAFAERVVAGAAAGHGHEHAAAGVNLLGEGILSCFHWPMPPPLADRLAEGFLFRCFHWRLAPPSHEPGVLVWGTQWVLDGLVTVLPDLGRLDLARPLLAGRTVSGLEVLDALRIPLPYIAGAVLLAGLVLGQMEIGLGGESER